MCARVKAIEILKVVSLFTVNASWLILKKVWLAFLAIIGFIADIFSSSAEQVGDNTERDLHLFPRIKKQNKVELGDPNWPPIPR